MKTFSVLQTMDPLPDAQICGLRMRRERFLRHRGLAIPTCIRHMRSARAMVHAGIAN